jgi:hypothetical protein
MKATLQEKWRRIAEEPYCFTLRSDGTFILAAGGVRVVSGVTREDEHAVPYP